MSQILNTQQDSTNQNNPSKFGETQEQVIEESHHGEWYIPSK